MIERARRRRRVRFRASDFAANFRATTPASGRPAHCRFRATAAPFRLLADPA
ncbi:hypothetical protein BSIN_5107 [Burkholderia singularis]|uniref:Uncharacterized protein n=1 Tax=Burkholderia singularis TaxID=1503053 RepID=A0A238HBA7_9BURK|nr:hypothetical protein BSIN_5107 [Burkholderia singularis]